MRIQPAVGLCANPLRTGRAERFPVVSQLVRSPGVHFGQSVDKSTEKDLHSVRVIPRAVNRCAR